MRGLLQENGGAEADNEKNVFYVDKNAVQDDNVEKKNVFYKTTKNVFYKTTT